MKEQTTRKPVDAKSELLYSHITSGALKYYDVRSLPFIRYHIRNNTSRPITFFVKTMIKSFSFEIKKSIEVQAKSSIYHYHLPIPDIRNMESLMDDIPVAVYTSVWQGRREDPLDEDTHHITLLAYNKICLAIPNPDKEGAYIPLFKHLDAWITAGKHDDRVKAILGKAAAFVGGRLKGYDGEIDPKIPRSQVEAIYKALRKEGKLIYITGAFDLEIKDRGVIQDIQPAGKSLQLNTANCIEGAVLFASLIEGAGLDAVIVIRPGHAFVGWKQWKGDETCEFLDTTLTENDTLESDSFKKAFDRGMQEYRKLQKQRPGDEIFSVKWSDDETFDIKDYAYLLDFKKIRQEFSEKEKDAVFYRTEEVKPLEHNDGSEHLTKVANNKEKHTEESSYSYDTMQTVDSSFYGVLVGVNDYTALARDGLHVCANDAEMLYQQLLVSSFHPSCLHLLTDETFTLPNSENIDSYLCSMMQNSVSDDLLLFYYSGSVRKEEQTYYLVTYETQRSNLYTTALELERVKQILETASARAKVVILDIRSADSRLEQDAGQSVEAFMQQILEQLEGLTVLALYKEKRRGQSSSIFTPLLVEQFRIQDHTQKGFLTVQDVYHNLTGYGDIQYPPYLSQPDRADRTILCYPSREQREYVLDAYRYMVKMQKSLEDVQTILIRRTKIEEADCNYAIDVLNKLEMPEIYPSSEDRLKVLDKLYSLDLQVSQLKERELEQLREDCKHQSTETQEECQSILQKINNVILPDVYSRVGELRITIMPR